MATSDGSTGSVNGFSVSGETGEAVRSEATGWPGIGNDFRDGGATGLKIEAGCAGATPDVMTGPAEGLS